MEYAMNTIYQAFAYVFTGFFNLRDAWTTFYWGDVNPGFLQYAAAVFVALSVGAGLATLLYFVSSLVAKYKPDSAAATAINVFGVIPSAILGLVLIPGLGFYVALGFAGLIIFVMAQTLVEIYAKNKGRAA